MIKKNELIEEYKNNIIKIINKNAIKLVVLIGKVFFIIKYK